MMLVHDCCELLLSRKEHVTPLLRRQALEGGCCHALTCLPPSPLLDAINKQQ
jgi:hypothetical protein